jgi:hypothetical protein
MLGGPIQPHSEAKVFKYSNKMLQNRHNSNNTYGQPGPRDAIFWADFHRPQPTNTARLNGDDFRLPKLRSFRAVLRKLRLRRTS